MNSALPTPCHLLYTGQACRWEASFLVSCGVLWGPKTARITTAARKHLLNTCQIFFSILFAFDRKQHGELTTSPLLQWVPSNCERFNDSKLHKQNHYSLCFKITKIIIQGSKKNVIKEDCCHYGRGIRISTRLFLFSLGKIMRSVQSMCPCKCMDWKGKSLKNNLWQYEKEYY